MMRLSRAFFAQSSGRRFLSDAASEAAAEAKAKRKAQILTVLAAPVVLGFGISSLIVNSPDFRRFAEDFFPSLGEFFI